jgi:hypothetical protein
LANLCKSASQLVASKSDTYFTQSFLYTGKYSSSACASRLWFCDNRGGNASNVGDDLRTLDEAAVVSSSGESNGSSDLVIAAGYELVGSSAGEGRKGRDDNSGETHVE